MLIASLYMIFKNGSFNILGENEAMKFEDGLFVKQVIEKVKEDVTHVLNTKVFVWTFLGDVIMCIVNLNVVFSEQLSISSHTIELKNICQMVS